MVRGLLVGIVLFVSSSVFSQNFEGKRMMMPPPQSYIQPGMIEGSATFSPAIMLNRESSNFYLSTFAAYTIERNISVRSDSYFFLSSADEDPFMSKAIRSYIGVFYHFRPNNETNWDKYIGFQPGITYMKRDYGGIYSIFEQEEKGKLTPSFALTVGTSFYVWDYFNFFANISYVNSKLRQDYGAPFNSDELIFSAGLGFQIQTRK